MLNLSGKNLHSVPRLEPLTGLKHLDLSANQISKIEGAQGSGGHIGGVGVGVSGTEVKLMSGLSTWGMVVIYRGKEGTLSERTRIITKSALRAHRERLSGRAVPS